MATFGDGEKKNSNTPIYIALAAVVGLLSLVLIVVALGNHPTHDDSSPAVNDVTNLAANDASNFVIAGSQPPPAQPPDSNAVFDPSGPNPLVTNDPSTAQLDPGTMNANAKTAQQNGDNVAAAEWWSLAAGKNDAEAQASLGVAFAVGRGVKMDDQAAFDLFQKSADQGNVNGESWVGAYYAHGYGNITMDPVKARYWYEKAAAQGDSDARDWLSKNPN